MILLFFLLVCVSINTLVLSFERANFTVAPARAGTYSSIIPVSYKIEKPIKWFHAYTFFASTDVRP